MDRDQADVLITYLEANRVNHQSVMDELDRDGISEQVLDHAYPVSSHKR